ncbi:MAG: tetratricopeptide repeat protein [Gemmataceae bacterium]|nr:tetratricopeptide repeat protein [Gemmataceae bacterium]
MKASPPSPRWRRRRVMVAVLCLLILVGFGWFVFYPSWMGSRHWQRAQEALEQFDLPRARDHLLDYLALHPGSAEGHFLLARTLRRADDYARANHHLKQAKRLGWIPELIELEQLLQDAQRTGMGGHAGELLQAFVKARHPEDRFILEALFKGDRATLNLGRAGHWLDLWIERYPQDHMALLWRGELLESFTHLDEAHADFVRLLELKPDHPQALLRLGLNALANRGNYAEAERYLGRYLEKHPDHPEALLGLARCQKGKGDLEAAAATVERLLARQPDHAEAIYLFGSLEADRGRPEEALRWLRRAASAGADARGTAHQMSLVLRRLGQSGEAAAYEEKFKTLDEVNRQLEQAMRAVRKEPRNPGLLHQVGSLRLRQGKEEQAIKWFLSALHEDPAYTPAHQALADYYATRKDAESASRAALHRRLAEKGKAAPRR